MTATVELTVADPESANGTTVTTKKPENEEPQDAAGSSPDGSIGSATTITNLTPTSPTPRGSTDMIRTSSVSVIGSVNALGAYRKPLDTVSRTRQTTPFGSVLSVDDMTSEERSEMLRRNLTMMFSCIYCVLLTMVGGVIYITHQHPNHRYVSEVFSTCMALTGMSWLIFVHIDLFRYKQSVLKKLIRLEEQGDRLSNGTDFILPMTFDGEDPPPYRFLQGRHSGSFYLKAGMAAFCFGHLINEGLQLGQQVLNYVQEDKMSMNCGHAMSVIVHIIRPLYSFYQLFVVFKYSNIVINRYKEVARFALMHIIATCLCFWFSTIVEDALEDYHHKLTKDNESNDTNQTEDHHNPLTTNETSCSSIAILSVNNLQAIPYLYPFTVEFNLLLAGVWFIVWQNIGKEHSRANPHHFRHKVNNEHGIEEVTYQSNLVISADCHASNKGLFAGLFLLLTAIITVIVFFVAITSKDYVRLGVSIHTTQEGVLTVLSLFGVLIAYRQLARLDFNLHPVTFLDDVLLFIPLPFFFVQGILSAMAETHGSNVVRIVMPVLVTLQVILQTPFIIDGLRRCSNSHVLRYAKPGREVVTFLIVCNLTMWIINTFEVKSVEPHYGQSEYYGELEWMLIGHTTLPLMLFYRFHSSVCLADIWKSAYEKGE